MKILESNWEQHFIQESQLLEDKLSRGEIAPMASRLKMALENNILDWSTYSLWAQQNYLLPVLKRGLYKDQVILLQKKINAHKAEFSHFNLQKLQMIALEKWENTLIVLGLEPSETLNSLGIEYILVLTPPEIITTLAGEALQDAPMIALPGAVPAPPALPAAPSSTTDNTELFDLADDSQSDESSSNSVKTDSSEDSSENLTPIDLPKFDDHSDGQTNVNFNELLNAIPNHGASSSAPATASSQHQAKKTFEKSAVSEKSAPEASENGNFVSSIDTIQYWNKINQDHNSLSVDARKYFDGYAVLKISQGKTDLFRLDEELQNEKLDPSLFTFNLDEPFFANLLKNRNTDSVSLKLLNKSILDFNYVCATPLFLGDKAVGFILGFKIAAMNEQDENALYRLMQSA